VTSPLAFRLLKMKREVDEICIPYEIGDPTISNSRISIRTAHHDVAFQYWQACKKKGQMASAFDPQMPQSSGN
jgi:hypothetical protein